MTKRLYDEVPFSRDYNYDKLTGREAGWALKVINGKKRDDYKCIVSIVLKRTLLLIVCFLCIYVTIFVLDLRETTEHFSNPLGSWVISRKNFSIFVNVTTAVFCVKEIVFWIKFRNVHRRFLIAKGNIANVRETNVEPDVFHNDGVKVTLTVAVSDNEALPPLDITYFRHFCDDIVIGDPIIVIYFPKQPCYLYLYKPWIDRGMIENC